MSLINDALKRVEQSINDNSPNSKLNPLPPSFSQEPSGPNKKLFFIALIGGTLFFTVLILLLVLIFSGPSSKPTSNEVPPPPPPTSNALIPSKNQTQSKENENLITEEPQQPSPPGPNNEDQNHITQKETLLQENSDKVEPEEQTLPEENPDATEDSNPPISSTSNNNGSKDLNDEFFKSIVNLASKAFTRTPTNTKVKNANNTTEPSLQEDNEPLENDHADSRLFPLSTAQTTLENLQRESQESKPAQKTKIEKYIDSLSVTGIMISKDESMALINNRVFNKGSIVNPDFNLYLIDIQPQKIVLKDSKTGATYDLEF
ncbi:MAG: hypothetical protein C5B43_00095 [Verrucomicrobia bacterium]|nr:MAG: hypothetical protein C5B43_00095 [Verrucomicrobiota bacterium]